MTEDWWTRLEEAREKQTHVMMNCLVCGESLAQRRLNAKTCSGKCRTRLSRSGPRNTCGPLSRTSTRRVR
jgi:hypothetical protein